MSAVRSKTDLVAHAVWAVAGRRPSLAPVHDAWLLDTLQRKVDALGGGLLSFGSADDHVHIVVRYPGNLALSTLVGEAKGYSAFIWNRATPARDTLAWQDGYWAESCRPDDLDALLRYVASQRRRHAAPCEPESWEAAW